MAVQADEVPRYSFPPQVAPIVALVLIVLLELVVPVDFLSKTLSLALGIPLLVAGFGLWGWGMATLTRAGESPDPAAPSGSLVTGGALGVSRNPIYTGGTIGLLGLTLLVDTATGVAVVVLLAVVAHRIVTVEETYLAGRFGEEYEAYRTRVRRWI